MSKAPRIGRTGWSVALLATTAAAWGAPAPLHWDDCFHAAVKKSEVVANQDELITQADEKHTQAIGSMLPQLTGAASHYNLSLPTTAFSNVQNTAQLTLSQPLFRGLRDLAGLRQTNDLTDAAKYTKRQTLVQLYQQVTAAFFQVIAAEKDIDNLESESKLYQKQIDQLEKWLSIGRSRKADVTLTKSQQAQLEGTLEASKSTLNTARESLAYLTGLKPDIAIEDSFPKHFDAPLEPLNDYLSSIQRRPEVVASRLNRDAADEGISIARGGHLPSMDLSGDFYLWRAGLNSFGNGSGSWDLLFSLSLPIFSGGVTQSQVRVAASQFHQNELGLSQDERQAEQEIRTYYYRVQNDEAEVKALVVAKNLAWQSYQQQMHDYGLSMATNIDALQALTSFTTTERSLDQARYQKRIDWLFLHVATGKIKELAF